MAIEFELLVSRRLDELEIEVASLKVANVRHEVEWQQRFDRLEHKLLWRPSLSEK